VLFGGGVFALAALALWIFCIIDVITTDEVEMRNLPKMVWLLLTIFLGAVGGIAWLIAGRPQGKSFQIANDGTVPRGGFVPPSDASSSIVHDREEASRLRMWEEQLRRREEELRRREQPEDE
jgi:hypothetical protein